MTKCDLDPTVIKAGVMPNTQRWIPCSERVPETEDKVLCCTQTKKGLANIVIGYYIAETDRWACGMNSNVTAWMPLPEPYREDEHEGD